MVGESDKFYTHSWLILTAGRAQSGTYLNTVFWRRVHYINQTNRAKSQPTPRPIDGLGCTTFLSNVGEPALARGKELVQAFHKYNADQNQDAYRS